MKSSMEILASNPKNPRGCRWFCARCWKCPRHWRIDGDVSLSVSIACRISLVQRLLVTAYYSSDDQRCFVGVSTSHMPILVSKAAGQAYGNTIRHSREPLQSVQNDAHRLKLILSIYHFHMLNRLLDAILPRIVFVKVRSLDASLFGFDGLSGSVVLLCNLVIHPDYNLVRRVLVEVVV